MCEILGGDGGPAVAALAGQSGAGKTTAAAAMVGERGDQVRVLFSDGVVWLRVGKGAGAADRLPRLMLKLAKRLHQDVMEERVAAPEAGEDGGSYVEKIVSQEKLKCLVVADDVCEAKVVEKLRATGMWVLLTTRFSEFVEDEKRVIMDTLTETEAEDVLRGAAELPPDERLCDDANHMLKICGRVAMDVAFVGNLIRELKIISKKAWVNTVEEIQAQGGGVDVGRDVNRLAILRAGFEYFGQQGTWVQKLYLMLTVFPDGHAFGESDAAVLLDGDIATEPLSILERWGVLRADASNKYLMHGVHVDFARKELMDSNKNRKLAVKRWTTRISDLGVAIGFDLYVLLNMWRALEEVGGEGWWALRPYDDQLVQMDASNHLNILAVRVVAEVYYHHRKFRELEEVLSKVLEQCNVHEGDCRQVEMSALTVLYYTRNAFGWQGRHREREDVVGRLGELGDPGMQLSRLSDDNDFLYTSTAFSMYGVCAKAAGRMEDAEEWFRKALMAQETGGLTASYQAVFVLAELGFCSQKAGRSKKAKYGEAEALLRRALEIAEDKLGADDLQVAVTRRDLGWCLLEAGRPGDAEPVLRRALEIWEAKLGPVDVQLAYALHDLARCVRASGKYGEAEALFRRALGIEEAKLGPDDVQVAETLYNLARCVQEARRLGEAEALFRRALGIKEAKLGPNDAQVAVVLHGLARCLRVSGKYGEAEVLLWRALGIEEANSGPDHPRVAYPLHELGVCVRESGKVAEAEALLRRALGIREAKLGPDDPQVAATRSELGVCLREVRAAGGGSDNIACQLM